MISENISFGKFREVSEHTIKNLQKSIGKFREVSGHFGILGKFREVSGSLEFSRFLAKFFKNTKNLKYFGKNTYIIKNNNNFRNIMITIVITRFGLLRVCPSLLATSVEHPCVQLGYLGSSARASSKNIILRTGHS